MSFHPQTQSFTFGCEQLTVEIFPFDIIISTRLISHVLSFFKRRAESGGCLAAPFQILILQTFNFTVVEMSKKELVRMKEKGEIATSTHQWAAGGKMKKKQQRQRKKPITHAGKPTVGKWSAGAACSESDNPPVSFLCVNQNFICRSEGKDSRRIGNNNNNLQPKGAASHRRRRELRESGNHRGNWYATHEQKGNGVVGNTNTHGGIHHTRHTIRDVD